MTAPSPRPRRVLAVDFGDRRTGLAATDPGGLLALPLEILALPDRSTLIGQIQTIARGRGSELVLLGVPLAPDGGLGARGATTAAFGRELAQALHPIPVLGMDERGTTTAAHARLKQAGMRAARRRSRGVDAIAALLILEAWLHGEPAFPLPLEG